MQDLQKAELQSADRGVCQQIGEGSKWEEVVQVKVKRVLPAKRRVGQRPGGIEEPQTAENGAIPADGRLTDGSSDGR